MNTRKKIFIVNNQEDEDGDNLYFGYPGIQKKFKRESELFALVQSHNKKTDFAKLPSRQKFVSDGASAAK